MVPDNWVIEEQREISIILQFGASVHQQNIVKKPQVIALKQLTVRMADNSASWDDDSTPSGAVQGPLSTTPKFISQLPVQSLSEGSVSGKATFAPPRTIDAFVETEEEVCETLFFQP